MKFSLNLEILSLNFCENQVLKNEGWCIATLNLVFLSMRLRDILLLVKRW